MIISGVGRERPVSTKLRWRVEISAWMDSSSWLRLRRSRQERSSRPTVGGAVVVTHRTLVGARTHDDYLPRNRHGHAAAVSIVADRFDMADRHDEGDQRCPTSTSVTSPAGTRLTLPPGGR